MTTNVLVPAVPRFFNQQISSQYFLLPAPGHPPEQIVLTHGNPSGPYPVEGQTMHPIPCGERESLPKRRTSPAQDFLFEGARYRSFYDCQKTSSKYSHVQDLSDIYDRDGIVSSLSAVKGRYVDLYL